MAVTLSKGYTFGSTELVTNTKLHTLVDSATADMSAPGAIGATTPAAITGTTITGTVITSTGGIVFPTSDPSVAGVWWDNAGTLTKSSG